MNASAAGAAFRQAGGQRLHTRCSLLPRRGAWTARPYHAIGVASNRPVTTRVDAHGRRIHHALHPAPRTVGLTTTTPRDRQQPMTSMPPKTTTLEVERKFAPTPASIELLTSQAQSPFASVVSHGTTRFEDTYYDTAPDGALSAAGVWIRRRGPGKWEAKVRVGGDYTNSAFEELTDRAAISALLGRLLPGAALDGDDDDGPPRGAGLREVARFVTRRTRFLVDGRFAVVLDEADFGHVVGEVELEREVPASGGGSGGGDFDRARAVADMDREIDAFMKAHARVFPAGKPVGKLSAYFALGKA